MPLNCEEKHKVSKLVLQLMLEHLNTKGIMYHSKEADFGLKGLYGPHCPFCIASSYTDELNACFLEPKYLLEYMNKD